MSPRSAEQFDDIRKQKKKLIMDTALELFAENGFNATSISQIARKAKISKGLTYNYFNSKIDILKELIDEGFHEVFSLMTPIQKGILSDEEFSAFIERSFDMVKKDLQHWKLLYSLMLQPTVAENFAEKYAKAAEPYFKVVYEFLNSKGTTDPEGDMMIISAMIEGALLYTVVATNIFPIELMKQKVIEGIFRIIETGNKK